ncbi:hypothetical protein [Neoroseomonas oryzicola]|uniref:Translation initiation factor 2 n=1 Tax=Neoroseomonas oryzicola TaxID=535904 RepID=A0A9X9WQE1_9PROT|nr:hypothetical protein [Neoroseomonas oryzicola]MBR0662551.1 hypothetical protein [Neoroseomonas oryzicola]NKE19290.1 hypothetical protein [Neoroseomonas oryzicola]
MPHATPAIRRALPLAAGLAGLLALAGCGSAVSDNTALAGASRPAPYPGSITLASEPPGASCVLTNTATQAAVGTVTTPAQVTLPRSTAIIEARCTAAGRMETVAMIRPIRDFAPDIHHPQPTGPTAVVQVADAVRTGRTRRYENTTVVMPPSPFASAEARDAWFADRAQAIRAGAAAGIAQAERAPQATIDTAETLRGYVAEDLARLDQQKAAATVESAPVRRR